MARKVYSYEFMQQNFGKLHYDTFKQEIGGGGHPDTGSGFYSQRLTYQNWLQFNNPQRVHLHFVEWIASYLFLLVCSGIYYPITSASIGLAIFISRIFYAIGYVVKDLREGQFHSLLMQSQLQFQVFQLYFLGFSISSDEYK